MVNQITEMNVTEDENRNLGELFFFQSFDIPPRVIM